MSPNAVARAAAVILILGAVAGCSRKEASEGTQSAAPAQVKLLNVSYDPTRELYTDVNAAFARSWKARTGQDVAVSQSHGGSGKQARAVIDGLEADVVTLALAYDVDAIADRGKLLPPEWQKRLPHDSSPYVSTIAFLVRKGNPKNIKSWDDLVRPDVAVILPNPKTSGSARWNYLAAWGFALRRELGDLAWVRDPARAAETKAAEAKAEAFVAALYKNVPVLDSGARGATTTFVSRGIGDVLVNWENEILLGEKELGRDKFEVVVPPVSILAEPTVSVVDTYVDKHGTRKAAEAYLEFLYTDEGQDIGAKHYFRPRTPGAAERHAHRFPKTELFSLERIAGDWRAAQKRHFDDGGVFDRIYKPK